jgi:alpha-tubulin suppressor-like RCC1 family protein
MPVHRRRTAAIKTDGSLWGWGNNTGGVLGLNTTINTSSPVQVGSLTNWKITDDRINDVASFIKTDGTLWVWGFNNFGAIGLNDTISRSSPVQVGSETTWTWVSSGSNGNILGIKNTGYLI